MAVRLPEELITKTAEGKTVLFVGAGMSRLSVLPGWTDLLLRAVDWAEEKQIKLGDAESIRRDDGSGNLTVAAQEIRSHMGLCGTSPFLARDFRNDKLKLWNR